MGLVALKVTTNLHAEFNFLSSVIIQPVTIVYPVLASSRIKLCSDFVILL